MRSLREIKKSIRQARVDAKPEADQAILRHLRAELATVSEGPPVPLKWHVRSLLLKATAAAAIVILALVMVVRPPQRTVAPPPEDRIHSASDLLTLGCLNAACRRGGLEAIDRQCEEAGRRLSTRPEKVSARELIEEFDGAPASKG